MRTRVRCSSTTSPRAAIADIRCSSPVGARLATTPVPRRRRAGGQKLRRAIAHPRVTFSLFRQKVTPFSSVVLVRPPACHAGGRGFEPVGPAKPSDSCAETSRRVALVATRSAKISRTRFRTGCEFSEAVKHTEEQCRSRMFHANEAIVSRAKKWPESSAKGAHAKVFRKSGSAGCSISCDAARRLERERSSRTLIRCGEGANGA